MTQELTQAFVEDDAKIPSKFSITLSDCVESAGVGLVSTERAQALIPPEFKLANDGQPVTPLVVLAMRCKGISVAGDIARAGALVQVGLVIVPPDGTGDVNTYTLWHYTTHATLARGLRGAGLGTQHVPAMSYDVVLGGKAASTRVTVPRPAQPPLMLAGSITEPNLPLSFAGNWWAKVDGGLLKMSSTVPNGSVGEAHLTLTTEADSPLGQLIGGDSMGFAALQRFNTFPHARTEVSIVAV